MKQELERLIRSTLHDLNNAASPVVANTALIIEAYKHKQERQKDGLSVYALRARQGIKATILQIDGLYERVRQNTNSQCSGEQRDMEEHFAAYIERFKGLKDTTLDAKQDVECLRNAYISGENQAPDGITAECIEDSLKGINHMIDLITQTQDMLRNKDINYTLARTSIAEQIEESIQIYRRFLRKEKIGIEFTREWVDGRPKDFYFEGDSLGLTQVMMNLLSNMMHELRKVDAPLINVHLMTMPHKTGYARISVANNGPRIDDTEGIFRKGKSGRNSSGIGLPICRHIVDERFGGRIYAENRRGYVVFYIEIPTVE